MEDMVSSDGQQLRAWYPTVWSREHEEANVAQTSPNGFRREAARERIEMTALRPSELAEPELDEPDSSEPELSDADVAEPEPDEQDLSGILEENDLSAARFDFDMWNEGTNLSVEPPPSKSSSEKVWGDGPSQEDEDVAFVEVPEQWAFAGHGVRRGRSKKRSSGRPSLSGPQLAEPDHSAPEHSAPEHSAPEHSAPEQSGPDVVAAPGRSTIRGGRHRRRHAHAIQEPEVEGVLSAPEPGTEGVAVLVGMPEGSRFASVIRVLAIALPTAGLTMAFLAYLR